MKIKEAAFRDSNNNVVGTGPIHDVSCLPEDFEIHDEGFLTEEDEFLTREEVTKLLNSSHLIQSQELDLEKAQVAPGFPKMGIQNPKETPIASGNEQKFDRGVFSGSIYKKQAKLTPAHSKAMATNHAEWLGNKKILANNPEKLKESKEKYLNSRKEILSGKIISSGKIYSESDKNKEPRGRTSPHSSPVQVSYSKLTPGKGDLSTKHHEDLHLTFGKVRQHFLQENRNMAAKGHKMPSPSTRTNIFASNLFHFINPESKDALKRFVNKSTKIIPTEPSGGETGAWHEEHLAHLMNYLTNPSRRYNFLLKEGLATAEKDKAGKVISTKLTPQGQEFDNKMKRGFREFQRAAQHADSTWGINRYDEGHLAKLRTVDQLRSRILPATNKNQLEYLDLFKNWEPSKEDETRAAHMMNSFYMELPEFRAAEFLAKGYRATEQDVYDAMVDYEGDFEAMALYAYKIPVNDSNIEQLRLIMSMQLQKSEPVFEVAAIPRIVKPFTEEDIEIADIVRKAFEEGKVHPVKLGGKHSSGSALFKDDEDDIWFLKPGSGKASSALGVSEEQASQSRREVAFNRMANEMGLGQYVPKSALLIIDGQEVAALEFFSKDYKPLDKLRKDPDIHLEQIFAKFVNNGLLYKWAAMDYLLGQPDRHAGNMMMDDGLNVRFIDAGSSMAGFGFNPAKDPKSFIPFYLRLFSQKKFKFLTPEERLKTLPEPTQQADEALQHWLDSLDRERLISMLNQFGINPEPFSRRLLQISSYQGRKSDFLRKFYSGNL